VRHDEADDDSMPGQDSFVDVICNLVGILITLVVVVGIRVSQVVIEPAVEATPAVARGSDAVRLQEDLQTAWRLRREAQQAIQADAMQARDLQVNSALIEAHRDQLALMRSAVEQEVAARREALDADAQRRFDRQREIAEAQIRLSALTQEQLSLMDDPARVEEIECVPTPIAKAVDEDAIHVRLRRGQIAIVPAAELMDELFRRGGSYLKTAFARREEAEDVYGPVNGFRMRFMVEAVQEARPRGTLTAASSDKRLVVTCIFFPVSPNIGQDVDQALLPDSEFMRTVRNRKSPTQAVVAWVYPDSYDALRTLKKALWDLDVPLSVFPRDNDDHIEFSNEGMRAIAQ
jgi:hypothetical protein